MVGAKIVPLDQDKQKLSEKRSTKNVTFSLGRAIQSINKATNKIHRESEVNILLQC